MRTAAPTASVRRMVESCQCRTLVMTNAARNAEASAGTGDSNWATSPPEARRASAAATAAKIGPATNDINTAIPAVLSAPAQTMGKPEPASHSLVPSKTRPSPPETRATTAVHLSIARPARCPQVARETSASAGDCRRSWFVGKARTRLNCPLIRIAASQLRVSDSAVYVKCTHWKNYGATASRKPTTKRFDPIFFHSAAGGHGAQPRARDGALHPPSWGRAHGR